MKGLVGCLPWETNGVSGTWGHVLVSTPKDWVTKEMTSMMDIYSFQHVQQTWLNDLSWMKLLTGYKVHSSTYWGSKSLLRCEFGSENL